MQQPMKETRAPRRPRRAKAEWIAEVARWRKSGLTATAYAAEHRLHPGTLMAWGSRVRHEVARKAPSSRSERVQFLPVRVAEVALTEAPARRGEIEVFLVNGRRLRISGDVQDDVVARLLDIAERGGRC